MFLRCLPFKSCRSVGGIYCLLLTRIFAKMLKNRIRMRSKQIASILTAFSGGIEGSRTPVRKKVLTTFYERSYLFILCAPTGNNTLRFEKALLFMTGYKAVCPCTVTAE